MYITNRLKQPVLVDRFKVLETLYKSGSGTIYHVKDIKKSEGHYLLKLFENTLNLQEINQQTELLKELNESILFLKTYMSKRSFNKFYIVFEMHNEDTLADAIAQKLFDETEASAILFELLEGLEYLHYMGVVHGGIKEQTILKHNGRYYLSTWDVGKKDKEQKNIFIDQDNRYTAPELYKEQNIYASDIYALGCILYKMLSGKYIYGLPADANFSQYMFAHFFSSLQAEKNISSKMLYLIGRMTEKDPQLRASIKEIKQIVATQKENYVFDITKSVEDKFQSKFERYKYMAQSGIGYAQNVLALMYEEGKEVKQDLFLAKRHYEEAIALGDSKAHFNLALLYKEGKWCRQDYKKALELLEYDGLQNHPRALYFRAEIYETFFQEKSRALIYFEKAAYLGYKPAFIKMAKIKSELLK
jgi:serine/threonine protein kinase